MLAFSFLIHTDEASFRHLFSQVYRREHFYAIHVDVRASDALKKLAKRIEHSTQNVFLVPSIACGWGGWSLVEAELRLIRRLLTIPNWTRLINLSGQCYPIKPFASIREVILATEENLVHTWPVDSSSLDVDRFRDWYLEFPLTQKNRLLRIPHPGGRKVPEDSPVFKGSQWKVLRRDFCEFAIRSEASLSLQRFFRTTFMADEHFFPTLLNVAGSGMAHENRNAHYINWRTLRPDVLDERDLEALKQSPKLFARKLVTHRSDSLRRTLDLEILGTSQRLDLDLRSRDTYSSEDSCYT